MTLDDARNLLADARKRGAEAAVTYLGGTPEAEEGTIWAVGHVWVFVTFGAAGSTPRATNPADLELLASLRGGSDG